MLNFSFLVDNEANWAIFYLKRGEDVFQKVMHITEELEK